MRDDIEKFDGDLRALIRRSHSGASVAEEVVYACAQERALLDFAERAFHDNQSRRLALAEQIRGAALPAPAEEMPRVLRNEQPPPPQYDDGLSDLYEGDNYAGDFDAELARIRAAQAAE